MIVIIIASSSSWPPWGLLAGLNGGTGCIARPERRKGPQHPAGGTGALLDLGGSTCWFNLIGVINNIWNSSRRGAFQGGRLNWQLRRGRRGECCEHVPLVCAHSTLCTFGVLSFPPRQGTPGWGMRTPGLPPPPQVLWFDINMYVCALSYICKYDRLL